MLANSGPALGPVRRPGLAIAAVPTFIGAVALTVTPELAQVVTVAVMLSPVPSLVQLVLAVVLLVIVWILTLHNMLIYTATDKAFYWYLFSLLVLTAIGTD